MDVGDRSNRTNAMNKHLLARSSNRIWRLEVEMYMIRTNPQLQFMENRFLTAMTLHMQCVLILDFNCANDLQQEVLVSLRDGQQISKLFDP